MRPSTEERYRYWRKRILISVWISYAMFYIGRVNMSIAIPEIMGEYGYDKTTMGLLHFILVCKLGLFRPVSAAKAKAP